MTFLVVAQNWGCRGEAFICSSRTVQVQCIGIEQDIARHSYRNSSFESLPSKHRRKGCISRQLCYSLAEVEADKDTLKVSFPSCHPVPSPCDTLATGSKRIATFRLPHLFHFSSTGSTHGRLFQCWTVGVKFRTFEDKDTCPHSRTFRDTWHTVVGPKKVVEWISLKGHSASDMWPTAFGCSVQSSLGAPWLAQMHEVWSGGNMELMQSHPTWECKPCLAPPVFCYFFNSAFCVSPMFTWDWFVYLWKSLPEWILTVRTSILTFFTLPQISDSPSVHSDIQ